MTFQQIYTELTDLRFNTQATKLAQVKKWVNQAEIALWNAADWSFKRVAPANLAIVAGNNTPTMPADFGKAIRLYDYNGDPLTWHDPAEFTDIFEEDIVRGTTGEPCDYTVVNRAVHLAPIPQTSRTYKLGYRRRYAHLNGAAATVAGVMSSDTDTPIWDSEHHYILVPWAMRIGQTLETDPTAAGLETLIAGLKTTSMFEAMVEELVGGQTGELRQWSGDAAGWR